MIAPTTAQTHVPPPCSIGDSSVKLICIGFDHGPTIATEWLAYIPLPYNILPPPPPPPPPLRAMLVAGRRSRVRASKEEQFLLVRGGPLPIM